MKGCKRETPGAGKAAPFIKIYMDTMHESVVAKKYYMRESVPTNAAFLTPKAVLASAQAFANATMAVSSDPLQVTHFKSCICSGKACTVWCLQ